MLAFLEPVREVVVTLLDLGNIEVGPEGVFADVEIPVPSLAFGVRRRDQPEDRPRARPAQLADPSPSKIGFNLSRREDPFCITVMGFGGTGSFELRPGGRRHRLPARLDGRCVRAGGLASRSSPPRCRAALGVELSYKGEGGVIIGAYVELSANASVLGLVNLTGKVLLALRYNLDDQAAQGPRHAQCRGGLALRQVRDQLDRDRGGLPGLLGQRRPPCAPERRRRPRTTRRRSATASPSPSGPTTAPRSPRPKRNRPCPSTTCSPSPCRAAAIGSTGGRLTVYFSPRLKERARLGRYAAWVDWPATLSGLNLVVRSTGPSSPHTQVGIAGLVRGVAGRLLAAVRRSRRTGSSTSPIRRCSRWRPRDFSERILELYLGHGPAAPGRAARRRRPGRPGHRRRAEPGTGGRGQQPGRGGRIPGADARRRGRRRAGRVSREFDFHASVSLLGHHPELLRHLGLAVDLEVDGLPANPTQRHG